MQMVTHSSTNLAQCRVTTLIIATMTNEHFVRSRVLCVQEWKNEGLRLSTTSNEAAKLYDVATSQVSSVNKYGQFHGVGRTYHTL